MTRRIKRHPRAFYIMPNLNRFLVFLILSLTAFGTFAAEQENTELQRQVLETEKAFARTMAERDFQAFVTYLSPEAIFFAGAMTLRGSDEVAAAWKPYFESAEAPFSWAPGTVEVLESGTLALSSGPVHDPEGQCIGTFTSIWRLNADQTWKIIFDKGSHDCAE